MTQLTLDCFDKINIPKDETVLFAPEGTEDFVEEVPQYDQDESRFKVRFRPNQFCNQYLMVAQTEQDEEDEDASHKDADQNIKELKHQVHRGFRTIQNSIAQQEQVIQEQGNGSSITGGKDFDEAVNAMVDQKLKERDAGYTK